jgi:hypothetical protein
VRVLTLPFPALWIVFFFSKPHKGTSKISWLWLSQDISLLSKVGFVRNRALPIFELSSGVAWIWSSPLLGFICWLTQTQPVESVVQSCLVGPVGLFQVAVSCPNFCHLRTPAPIHGHCHIKRYHCPRSNSLSSQHNTVLHHHACHQAIAQQQSQSL